MSNYGEQKEPQAQARESRKTDNKPGSRVVRFISNHIIAQFSLVVY